MIIWIIVGAVCFLVGMLSGYLIDRVSTNRALNAWKDAARAWKQRYYQEQR